MGWADADCPYPGIPLLFLTPLLGCLCVVAGDVDLWDAGAVYPPVDGSFGGHGVGEGVPTPSRPEPALSHDWGLEVMPRDLL